MEKIVTIAAGILCTDGMVVCADTEHSISDDRKSQGSKLRVWQSVYRKDDDDESDTRMSIAFAGAGHSDWISAYIQGIDDDELTDVPNDFNLDIFEKRLKKFNQDFFKTYIRPYAENPNHRPQTHVLVLTQFLGSRRAIYHAHENIVIRAEDKFYVAVGVGAPVFESWANSLLGTESIYKPAWTMREASAIAIYILDKVKAEVPGCGGKSHILMISKDGEEKVVPNYVVKQLENYQAIVESRCNEKLVGGIIKKLP